MNTQTFSDVAIVNKLGMLDFHITFLNGYDERLVIEGDREYPQFYRVKLTFFDVEYVACAPYFNWCFHFRMATAEETAVIHRYVENAFGMNVYCLEEDLPPQEGSGRTFFIAARKLEITVYYSGESLDALMTGPFRSYPSDLE